MIVNQMTKFKPRPTSKKKTLVKKSIFTHRPSKNYSIPMLVTLICLVAGSFLIYKKMITPLGINEVASAPACNSSLISDNFDGASLDVSRYSTWLSSATSAVTQSGGSLNMISATPDIANHNTGASNKTLVTGNFIAEITVSNLQAAPINRTSAELAISNSGFWSSLAWRRHDGASYIDFNTGSEDGSVAVQTVGHLDVGTATTIKLKIARSGTTTYGYADIGNGYQDVGTLTNSFAGPGYIQPILFDYSNTAGNSSSVSFDNLIFHCPSSKPTIVMSCSGNTPVANITWAGGDPDGSSGFIVNLFETPWNGNYSNKTVGNVHATDSSRFVGTSDSPLIKGKTLALESGKKYSSNIWNGTQSPDSDVVTVPVCNTKPPAPTNLKFTCNPDGKSVRLMWDGVVSSESYKVRLDDKNGKVTNFDNLKEAQYITSVTPNKQYSFWVHSSKSSQDSNQSTAIDFTCKVTATPTPTPKTTIKPTIKPTVKPTSAPTITATPIATPKASIYTPTVQRESTNLSDLKENVETTQESELKPTNPISKFFLWLAGLFE